MPPLTREQLAARRAARRRGALRRDRRALVSAAIPVIVVAVLALVLGVMGGGSSSDVPGPLASPSPSAELGSGARPPQLVIARAEGVDVHIPVDPSRVTAMAFHAIDDTAGVALESSGVVTIHQSAREGRVGPDTAGLDVGAPAGTTVYSPVDGTIASVSDYVISGKVAGYEVDITPSVASSGLLLRVTHLDDPGVGSRPSVGLPVRAGVTPLGRVKDFTSVATQQLSRFTADAGNHVDLELVRTEAALIL
jgi:murein DD-endopeptidase MepM/ murein hydrolase activator NlpD